MKRIFPRTSSSSLAFQAHVHATTRPGLCCDWEVQALFFFLLFWGKASKGDLFDLWRFSQFFLEEDGILLAREREREREESQSSIARFSHTTLKTEEEEEEENNNNIKSWRRLLLTHGLFCSCLGVAEGERQRDEDWTRVGEWWAFANMDNMGACGRPFISCWVLFLGFGNLHSEEEEEEIMATGHDLLIIIIIRKTSSSCICL